MQTENWTEDCLGCTSMEKCMYRALADWGVFDSFREKGIKYIPECPCKSCIVKMMCNTGCAKYFEKRDFWYDVSRKFRKFTTSSLVNTTTYKC